MHIALRTRRSIVLCQLSSTVVNGPLPLFFLHSLTYGPFMLIGGQHFSGACLEYRTQKGSPYVDCPLQSMPPWMRTVYATILRGDTPVHVCTSAAARHQQSQQNSNPLTTSAWAQYLCITLGKTNEDFVNGAEMDFPRQGPFRLRHPNGEIVT